MEIAFNKLSISVEEALLCSASFLISSATTAKPFPDSPALAASIAAFSAIIDIYYIFFNDFFNYIISLSKFPLFSAH